MTTLTNGTDGTNGTTGMTTTMTTLTLNQVLLDRLIEANDMVQKQQQEQNHEQEQEREHHRKDLFESKLLAQNLTEMCKVIFTHVQKQELELRQQKQKRQQQQQHEGKEEEKTQPSSSPSRLILNGYIQTVVEILCSLLENNFCLAYEWDMENGQDNGNENDGVKDCNCPTTTTATIPSVHRKLRPSKPNIIRTNINKHHPMTEMAVVSVNVEESNQSKDTIIVPPMELSSPAATIYYTPAPVKLSSTNSNRTHRHAGAISVENQQSLPLYQSVAKTLGFQVMQRKTNGDNDDKMAGTSSVSNNTVTTQPKPMTTVATKATKASKIIDNEKMSGTQRSTSTTKQSSTIMMIDETLLPCYHSVSYQMKLKFAPPSTNQERKQSGSSATVRSNNASSVSKGTTTTTTTAMSNTEKDTFILLKKKQPQQPQQPKEEETEEDLRLPLYMGVATLMNIGFPTTVSPTVAVTSVKGMSLPGTSSSVFHQEAPQQQHRSRALPNLSLYSDSGMVTSPTSIFQQEESEEQVSSLQQQMREQPRQQLPPPSKKPFLSRTPSKLLSPSTKMTTTMTSKTGGQQQQEESAFYPAVAQRMGISLPSSPKMSSTTTATITTPTSSMRYQQPNKNFAVATTESSPTTQVQPATVESLPVYPAVADLWGMQYPSVEVARSNAMPSDVPNKSVTDRRMGGTSKITVASRRIGTRRTGTGKKEMPSLPSSTTKTTIPIDAAMYPAVADLWGMKYPSVGVVQSHVTSSGVPKMLLVDRRMDTTVATGGNEMSPKTTTTITTTPTDPAMYPAVADLWGMKYVLSSKSTNQQPMTSTTSMTNASTVRKVTKISRIGSSQRTGSIKQKQKRQSQQQQQQQPPRRKQLRRMHSVLLLLMPESDEEDSNPVYSWVANTMNISAPEPPAEKAEMVETTNEKEADEVEIIPMDATTAATTVAAAQMNVISKPRALAVNRVDGFSIHRSKDKKDNKNNNNDMKNFNDTYHTGPLYPWVANQMGIKIIPSIFMEHQKYTDNNTEPASASSLSSPLYSAVSEIFQVKFANSYELETLPVYPSVAQKMNISGFMREEEEEILFEEEEEEDYYEPSMSSFDGEIEDDQRTAATTAAMTLPLSSMITFSDSPLYASVADLLQIRFSISRSSTQQRQFNNNNNNIVESRPIYDSVGKLLDINFIPKHDDDGDHDHHHHHPSLIDVEQLPLYPGVASIMNIQQQQQQQNNNKWIDSTTMARTTEGVLMTAAGTMSTTSTTAGPLYESVAQLMNIQLPSSSSSSPLYDSVAKILNIQFADDTDMGRQQQGKDQITERSLYPWVASKMNIYEYRNDIAVLHDKKNDTEIIQEQQQMQQKKQQQQEEETEQQQQQQMQPETNAKEMMKAENDMPHVDSMNMATTETMKVMDTEPKTEPEPVTTTTTEVQAQEAETTRTPNGRVVRKSFRRMSGGLVRPEERMRRAIEHRERHSSDFAGSPSMIGTDKEEAEGEEETRRRSDGIKTSSVRIASRGGGVVPFDGAPETVRPREVSFDNDNTPYHNNHGRAPTTVAVVAERARRASDGSNSNNSNSNNTGAGLASKGLKLDASHLSFKSKRAAWEELTLQRGSKQQQQQQPEQQQQQQPQRQQRQQQPQRHDNGMDTRNDSTNNNQMMMMHMNNEVPDGMSNTGNGSQHQKRETVIDEMALQAMAETTAQQFQGGQQQQEHPNNLGRTSGSSEITAVATGGTATSKRKSVDDGIPAMGAVLPRANRLTPGSGMAMLLRDPSAGTGMAMEDNGGGVVGVGAATRSSNMTESSDSTSSTLPVPKEVLGRDGGLGMSMVSAMSSVLGSPRPYTSPKVPSPINKSVVKEEEEEKQDEGMQHETMMTSSPPSMTMKGNEAAAVVVTPPQVQQQQPQAPKLSSPSMAPSTATFGRRDESVVTAATGTTKSGRNSHRVSLNRVQDGRGDWGIYTGNVLKGIEPLVPDGYGEMTYDSGNWYKGEWVNGHWEGYGQQGNTRGDIYEGSLVNDRREGQGTLRFDDGRLFEGSFKDDYMLRGLLVFRDKSQYNGMLQNGKRNGYGTNTYADGSKYEGEWENDTLHGKGTITWSDGGSYQGDWINGTMHGQGIEYRRDGSIRHEGEFRNGYPIRH